MVGTRRWYGLGISGLEKLHSNGPEPNQDGPFYSLFVWLVADGWCWFVLREKYCWLVASGWFVLREKYC
jgi:hypothetical protein